MDKGNTYPNMPEYQRMPDAPPNYNQSFPTAPSATGAGMMPPSSGQNSMPQPQPMVIQNLPPIPPLGPKPCMVTCPSCHHQQMSIVCLKASSKTHLFAALLCFLGCCCCVCVPYYIDSCQNANHFCGHCNAYLGVYRN